MEDTRWLRLVTIGLVLAAVAVGYFLLAQRFSGTNSKVSDSKGEIVVVTPSPQPASSPATQSAYQRIAERTTKGGVSELPATGFPVLLTGILVLSAAIAGFGLRKFPK